MRQDFAAIDPAIPAELFCIAHLRKWRVSQG